MADIDLSNVRDSDGLVISFGGSHTEIDSYTFANALVAVADAIREINSQVNQGVALEVQLEALSDGSFKAKIKGMPKSLKNLFSVIGVHVILPLLIAFLYDELKSDKIIVNENEVIIQSGRDRIIIPRNVYETAKRLPNKPAIRSHIARAISVVNDDEKVESFGLYKNLDPDSPPLVIIPRSDFTRVIEVEVKDDPLRRKNPVRVTIYVVKAVFQSSNRKWEFVWNGVKISAPIIDPVFLADLLQRKYLIGSGDALDVTLNALQRYDTELSVWINDGYEVEKVWEHIPASSLRPLDMLP